MKTRITVLSLVLAIMAVMATLKSNAFIDGDVPHYPLYGLMGAFFTLAFLLSLRRVGR